MGADGIARRLQAAWNGLTASTSPDPDDARREHATRAILAITSAALLPFTAVFAVMFVTGLVGRGDIVVVAVVDLLAAGLLVVAVRGGWRLAALLLPAVFLSFPVDLTLHSGAWSPVVAFYALGLVLASALLEGRWPWVTLAACMVAYGIAGGLQGELGAADLVTTLVSVGAAFTGIVLLLRFSSWQLQLSLRDVRHFADGLEREIGERKQAEEAARKAADTVRALFESIPDGVATIDPAGRIKDVNEAMARLLGGGDKGRLAGFNTMGFVAAVDRSRAMADLFSAPARASPSGSFRYRLVSFDGREFEAQVSSVLVRDATGRPVEFIAVVRDITESLAMEAQLRQAQKMEAVGRLAGGVAHDFNNLLQAIQGNIDLAIQEGAAERPGGEPLEEAMKASRRAGALVGQLLAFGRREAWLPRVLDLNATVRGVSRMLSRLIGEHIALDVRVGEGLRNVLADAGQMEQVIVNLCINARDAMPQGGGILLETANIDLDTAFAEVNPWAKPGAFVFMRVTDTGHGMDAATIERIFEPFFTTKKPGEGTGMGLTIVYGIAKRHGGFVHCRSAPGRGTEIALYLPALPAGTPAASESVPDDAARPGAGETILLAEDDEQVRILADRTLRKAGYRVLAASDGEEAVQIFEARPEVDLVLMDVAMPRLNGKAAADRMRAERPSVPVLFTSGYDFQLLDATWRGPEGGSVLRKPYRSAELLESVRRALDLRIGAP